MNIEIPEKINFGSMKLGEVGVIDLNTVVMKIGNLGPGKVEYNAVNLSTGILLDVNEEMSIVLSYNKSTLTLKS